MKNNFLNSYVFDELNSVEKHLVGFIITKDPENLHRLRVSIKKIKAILTLAEKAGKIKYTSAELDLLFKDAGKIREVQINSNLLLNFTDPPENLISRLKKKEVMLVLRFIKHAPIFLERMSKFREQICFLKKIQTKKIRKFFDKSKNKANSYIERGNRIDLHRYRKKLKQIMYVYHCLPVHLQQDIKIDKEKTKRLQQKIGEWHDIYTAVNFISHAKVPKSYIRNIEKLKDKQLKLYEALLNNLQIL